MHSSRQWRCLVNLRFPGDGERSRKLWVDGDDDEWGAFRYALSHRSSVGSILGSGDGGVDA